MAVNLIESRRYRPQAQMDRTLWGGRLPWRRDWINDPDSSDPYLQEDIRGMLREIPNKVKLSVYVVEGHLRSWENLSAVAKAHSRLEIYPGNHGFAPSIYGYIEAKQVGYSTEHDALTERINEAICRIFGCGITS